MLYIHDHYFTIFTVIAVILLKYPELSKHVQKQKATTVLPDTKINGITHNGF
jgi:hypothetical protein